MKANQEWLRSFVRDNGNASNGKLIWLDKGKVVENFKLDEKNRKLLTKKCGEADRKEAFSEVPINVIISKVNNVVTIKVEGE